MFTCILCTLALLQPGDSAAPPPHVKDYLQRCEEAKAAQLKVLENEVKKLVAIRNPTRETVKKLDSAKLEVARHRDLPARLLPLPLPPKKGELGVFVAALAIDARRGKSVDVLEVIDKENAIVRAWYSFSPDEDPTFVDLWLRGIDTSGMEPKSAAKLAQVFHVTGSHLFDTTCGKRSLPLLVAVEIGPYRKKGGQ